jgi:putative ABC transport system permease protein
VRMVEGRAPQAGALEAMTGKAARDRYPNLDVGSELRLGRAGNRNYRIVGVFEAGGGALESEIWAPRTIVSDTYNRRFDSSVVMRLAEGASARAAIEYINGSVVQLEGKLETAYYEDLAKKTREIVTLTTILVGIMAIGAVFAVANTMYAAVDGRRREIAMLRTIGFARGAIIVSFMIESILICTTACVAGLGASLLINGSRQDFLSDTTWTVLAYELRITPGILAAALGLATLVGVGGALAPALKASRTRVIEALRKA